MQPLVVLNASNDYALRELFLKLASIANIPLLTYCSADDLIDSSKDVPCGISVVDANAISEECLLAQIAAISSHARVVLVGDFFPLPFVVSALKQGCADVLAPDGNIAEALLCHLRDELNYQSAMDSVYERLATLTVREREVLQLMLAGASVKQLSLKLGIADKTARIHSAHVLKKMRVENTVELANLIFLKLSTNLDPRLRRWFPAILEEQHV